MALDSGASSPTRGWIAALLAVALLDLGLRAFETRLSGDAEQIAAFPAVALALSASGPETTALVGNSLIGEGVLEAELGALLSQATREKHEVGKFVADASNLWEWRCILERTVEAMETKPSRVVVGFGWDQVSDQTRLDASRAFNQLCGLRTLRDLGPMGFGERLGRYMEVGLIKTSKLYAQREALRNGLLRRVVPGYEEQTQRLNRGAGRANAPRRTGAATYERLEAVLDRMNDSGVAVTLLAMPVVAPYDLDPAICTALSGRDAQLLDFRSLPGIETAMYRDPIHLNAEGASVVTRALARELSASHPNFDGCAPALAANHAVQ